MHTINKYGILNEQSWESDNTKQLNYYKIDPISIDKYNGVEYIVPNNNLFTKIAKVFNKSYASFNLAINKDELLEAKKWKYKIILKNINTYYNLIIKFKHYLQNNNLIMICMSIDIDQMNKYPKYFSSDYKFPRIIVFTNNNNNFSVDNSHAMIIVGYNDNYHAFKILNSWGKSWGYQGFCYMSYDIFDQSLTKTKIISSALIIDKILI
jgi:hypothetical protein